jgi:hypothetical protein
MGKPMKDHTATAAHQNNLKFAVLIKPYWKNILIFIFTGLVLTILSLPYPWFTKVMKNSDSINRFDKDTKKLQKVF